jgi:hypothetical protein
VERPRFFAIRQTLLLPRRAACSAVERGGLSGLLLHNALTFFLLADDARPGYQISEAIPAYRKSRKCSTPPSVSRWMFSTDVADLQTLDRRKERADFRACPKIHHCSGSCSSMHYRLTPFGPRGRAYISEMRPGNPLRICRCRKNAALMGRIYVSSTHRNLLQLPPTIAIFVLFK